MPDSADRRTAPRLTYTSAPPARLYLNGEVCTVLDLTRGGVRYELPAKPVRPAVTVFEAKLALACGETIPVMGRVVRAQGPVAAARLDPTRLSDLQLAREREFLRRTAGASASDDRRRWRARPQPTLPHEPRRSEA